MRTRALLAVLLATTFISSGCSGMRSRERGFRDQVQLPAAPKLETTPPGSMAPTSPAAPSLGGGPSANMSGPSVSPLSATSPVSAGVPR